LLQDAASNFGAVEAAGSLMPPSLARLGSQIVRVFESLLGPGQINAEEIDLDFSESIP